LKLALIISPIADGLYSFFQFGNNYKRYLDLLIEKTKKNVQPMRRYAYRLNIYAFQSIFR